MAYEWLTGKESKLINRERLPHDGRLRITRGWRVTNDTQRQVGELRLEVYCDVKNNSPQTYVENPDFGRKESITGTFRSVRVSSEFDARKGEGFVYQTLEEGFLQEITTGNGDDATFDWTNARLANGSLSAERTSPVDDLVVYWRGISPSKVQACANSLVALPAASKFNVTITLKGEIWGETWIFLTANPSIAEDGTGIVTAHFGKSLSVTSESKDRFYTRTSESKTRQPVALDPAAPAAGTMESVSRGRADGVHVGTKNTDVANPIIFPANAGEGEAETPVFLTTARTQAYEEGKRVLRNVEYDALPQVDDEDDTWYGFANWALSAAADRFDCTHIKRTYTAFYQGSAGSWDETESGPFYPVKPYRGNSGQIHRHVVFEEYVYTGDDIEKAIAWLAGTRSVGSGLLQSELAKQNPTKFIVKDESGWTIKGAGRVVAWAALISSEGGLIAGPGKLPVASGDTPSE